MKIIVIDSVFDVWLSRSWTSSPDSNELNVSFELMSSE